VLAVTVPVVFMDVLSVGKYQSWKIYRRLFHSQIVLRGQHDASPFTANATSTSKVVLFVQATVSDPTKMCRGFFLEGTFGASQPASHSGMHSGAASTGGSCPQQLLVYFFLLYSTYVQYRT
jgi:hypothetical protein